MRLEQSFTLCTGLYHDQTNVLQVILCNGFNLCRAIRGDPSVLVASHIESCARLYRDLIAVFTIVMLS
jgi:hypothetical protein